MTLASAALPFPASTSIESTPSPDTTQQRASLADAVAGFIATAALEYGRFDPSLFEEVAHWIGPLARELRLTARHIPNDCKDPAHEVIVLGEGAAHFLYTAVQCGDGLSLVLCARPGLSDSTHEHVLLHATESVFRASLATPESPFIPVVPDWVRSAR